MTHRRRFLITTLLVPIAAIGVYVISIARHSARADSGNALRAPLAVPILYNEAHIRDDDIVFYTRRMREDPGSALDRSALAGLLFARSRNTGSAADLAKAEKLARQSIGIRVESNGQTYELLASVLTARHAFREARVVAAQADSAEPDTPSHLALLGEIELELGAYDDAAAHFKAIHFDSQQFTIGARLARWYELTGRIDIARQFLTRAIDRVSNRDDLPREQVAWFHYRLGELELRAGQLNAADSAFQQALIVHEDDVRALGGLARVALARGAWRRAVDLGERATALQLDAGTLGTVSAAYVALRDSAQAASFANAMMVSAREQPGTMHRAWGMFLLDHGSSAQRKMVLTRARRDLMVRNDVYGQDLLAWAMYRTGQLDDARAMMTKAMSQHTQDVLFTTHARAIGVEIPIG